MTSDPQVANPQVRLRQLVNRALSPSLKRRYRHLKRSGRQFRQRLFDRSAGTDTTGIVQDPTGSGKSSGHEYEATAPSAFRRLVRRIPDDLSDFTFIDVGSGKGAVLLYASRRPFRAVIGVEHSQALHEVAVRNIERYRSRRGRRMRCTDVTSLLHDATTYRWPPGPLVVYLYSPLPRDGVSQILANLQQSLSDAPRRVYLVALNPFDDLYSSQPWLTPVHRGWSNSVIYRAG